MPRSLVALLLLTGLVVAGPALASDGPSAPQAAVLELAAGPQQQEEHGQEEQGGEHGDAHGAQADEHGEEPAAALPDHAGEHGGEHVEDHGAHHGEHLELPHLIMVLRNHGPFAGDKTFKKYSKKWENVFFALLAGTVVSLIAWTTYRRRSQIPGRLQAFSEMLVEQVLNITTTMMGDRDGRKYAPFVGTIFVYLLAMNYSVLVPLGKSPTATLINNASIAIVVFFYVQYIGIKRNGIGGYVHHLMGSPRDLVGWLISPLMLFLEVIGEFIKPMSLSLRLFGNIFGEDTLLAVFALLGVVTLSSIGSPVGIPLHLPFLFLSMLLGLIQALVFSLLATVYITLMLPHDDHGHEHAAAH